MSQPESLFDQTEREREEEFFRTFPQARLAAEAQASPWYSVHFSDQHLFPGTSFSYGPPPPEPKFPVQYIPTAESSLQHAVTDPASPPQPRPSRSLPCPPAVDPPVYHPPDPPYDALQHPSPPPAASRSSSAQSPVDYYPPADPAPITFLPLDAASPLYTDSPPGHFSQPSFGPDHWRSSPSTSPFAGSDYAHEFVKSESPEPFNRPGTSSSLPRRASIPHRNTRWPPRSPSPPPVRIPLMAGGRRAMDKKPPLACLFCRGRKIACGPPLAGSKDKTCNQCQRRSLKCEYPLESRRGMRKKKDVSDTISTEGPKVVIAKPKH